MILKGSQGYRSGILMIPVSMTMMGNAPVSRVLLISVARHVNLYLPHHIAQSCGRRMVRAPLTGIPQIHLLADGSARMAMV
jgi:hypothetical protein